MRLTRVWPVGMLGLLVAAATGPTQQSATTLAVPVEFVRVVAAVAVVLAVAYVALEAPPAWLSAAFLAALVGQFGLRAVEFVDSPAMPSSVAFWGNVAWCWVAFVMVMGAERSRRGGHGRPSI